MFLNIQSSFTLPLVCGILLEECFSKVTIGEVQ